MFNLVGHIRGGNRGLTHLQYADDTILFMDYNDQTITNMKFPLYCFEWMTGLKINYLKLEVVVMGYNTISEKYAYLTRNRLLA